MVAAILAAAGHHTIAAGNVGVPLVTAVLAEPRYDVIVAELSSFQLHWMPTASPDTGAVLNIAEDHLDWHGSIDDYAADKARVWRSSYCGVYNADDPRVAALGRKALSCGHPFTLGDPTSGGFGIVDDMIVDRCCGWGPEDEEEPPQVDGGVVLAHTADLTAPGRHNLANAVAATATARVAGLQSPIRVPVAAVAAGLRAYTPGPHRNAVVGVVDDVTYVDDSKATNPHAAAASLSAYDSVVWIAGGLLKGANVDELVAAERSRLRGVVLIGRDRGQIAAAIARHARDVPLVEVTATDTRAMSEAVQAAARLAHAGDTVLLAPAAASMDMFTDYAQRGEAFAAAVRALGPVRS
jgi:UDP-N-acetylmuramoylalanine--D-glutamate ligase